MTTEKKIDIVVFGATGDTGRCASHFLHNQGKRIGVESWAPAARNLEKLNKQLGPILGEDKKVPSDGVPSSAPIKADSNDYESILAMAKQAKVIVACAGPFGQYGENVVKACVEAGTDYVDITGETPWVNMMAKKYGPEAKKKGVYLVSQAAFDSVPSDIGVALAATTLMEKGEKVGRAENHFTWEEGALPVGTLNTILNMSMMIRRKILGTLTFGVFGGLTAEEKAKSEEMKKYKDIEGLVPTKAKSAVKRDMIKNYTTLHSSMTRRWQLPFFMIAANTPIVHTTAEKLGYGASQGHGFTYGEYYFGSQSGNFEIFALSMLGLIVGPMTGIPLPQVLCTIPIGLFVFPFGFILIGLALGGILGVLIGLPVWAFFPGVVCSISKAVNNSDPGNRKKMVFDKLFNGFQEFGFSMCESTVQSANGEVVVRVSMKSNYDMGLGFTTLCACTVASSLIERRNKGLVGTGFDTAVGAIGPKELKTNLEKVRVEFKVES